MDARKTTCIFFHRGSFSHVKPHARGWNVDYFASVFVGNANVFDAEMQHVSFEKDPIFAKFEHLNQTNLSFITSVISSTLARSGAKVPYARAFDRHDTATEDLSFIDKSMMWWRVKYGRTARENFIRMLKELEMMWHAAQKEERKQRQQYSYVLIVRDDVWWLKDFDLDLLVRTGGVQKAVGRNAGHVYSAPCKNRPTKGLVDHVFLFDRSAAEIMGSSYSRIVRPGDFGRAWLEHLEAEKPKNSENFYMQLANFSGFEINEVPGALLPMQRTGRLNSTVCLHKYCDIVDPVLPYKYDIPRCHARHTLWHTRFWATVQMQGFGHIVLGKVRVTVGEMKEAYYISCTNIILNTWLNMFAPSAVDRLKLCNVGQQHQF